MNRVADVKPRTVLCRPAGDAELVRDDTRAGLQVGLQLRAQFRVEFREQVQRDDGSRGEIGREQVLHCETDPLGNAGRARRLVFCT